MNSLQWTESWNASVMEVMLNVWLKRVFFAKDDSNGGFLKIFFSSERHTGLQAEKIILQYWSWHH